MANHTIKATDSVAPQLWQLEQRLMFDGAAVDTTVEVIAELSSDPVTETPTEGLFSLAVAYGQSQVAGEQAQQQVKEYLQEASVEELFDLFNGGKAEIDIQWLQSMEQLRQAVLTDKLSLTVELLDNEALLDAHAAFSAQGADGNPVIYLNQDFAQNADSASLTRVLIEEFGHAIDYVVNGVDDTAGDEGERFVATVMNDDLATINLDDDQAVIEVDGELINVEFASYDFINAYEVTNTADKETNLHEFDYSQALGQVTVNDDTSSHLFSGNDVSAIGIIIGGETLYGWISRPIKAQGEVRGFYFWADNDFTTLATAQADGNQDGDSNPADNRGFVLVVDQAYFDGLSFFAGTLKDVGSSSDRVDSSLNSVLLAANSAPVANPDTNTISEGSVSATGNVLNNDTDADGDTLSVTEFVVNGQSYAAGATANLIDMGTLVINTDGTYIFAPDANYTGSIPSVTYLISDGGGGTAASTLNITVTPENDPPAGGKLADGSDDPDYDSTDARYEIITPEDTPIDGQVKAYDVDGDSLIYSKATGPSHGSVTVNSDGTYTYTPTLDYVGNDTFTVTVADGNGGTDTITVYITVTPVNDGPVATSDNVDTGAQLAIEAGGDSNGTAGQAATGNVLDNDVGGETGDTLTVTQVGTGVADQSVATSTTSADGSVVIGQYGTLTLGADGSYVYVVNDNNAEVQALRVTGQTLTETFTYRISDGSGGAASTTLTVTIDGRNDAPLASDDYDIAKETTTSPVVAGFDASGNVLTNDTDVDGNGETKSITELTAEAIAGTITDNITSSELTFVGESGFTSVSDGKTLYINDSGVYRAVHDSAGNLVTVSGSPVEDSSVAGTYSVTLSGTAAYYLDGSSTQVPISSLDGLTVGFKADTAETTGTSSLKAATVSTSVQIGGSLVDVNTLVSGNIAQGMTVSGTGVPAGTTVTNITYDPTSGAITSFETSQLITTTSGTTLAFSASAGTVITGHYGTLTLGSDGNYTYTATTDNPGLSEGESATESFQYTMSDAAGATSKATLYINVLGTGGTDPVATPDTNSVTEDASLPATGNVLTDTTADTTDTEGVVIRISSLSQVDTIVDGAGDFEVTGLYGTLKIKPDGSYVYTLDDANSTVNALHDSEILTDTFQYQVLDPSGGSYTGIDSSTLTITINGKNDLPVGGKLPDGSADPAFDITDNRYEIITPEDTPIDGQVKALDSDDGSLVYSKATDPTNGTVTVNADGTYTYTPANNYVGNDSFTVQVSDGNGGLAAITVFVTVTPVADTPVLDLDGNDSSSATGADYITSFTIGGGTTIAVADSDNSITDVDDTHIETGTVVLTNAKPGDVLIVSSLPSGITSSIDTSVSGQITVTLNGSAALADYQSALQAISFSTTGSDVADRTVTTAVNDGDNSSNVAITTITVNPDNRALSVTGVTVNEASPYAVFTVSGNNGQRLTLKLDSTSYIAVYGNALLGLDTGNAGSSVPLQYLNASNAWVDYSPDSSVTMNGSTLLVRTAIRQDSNFEGEEKYTLIATNEAGNSASGEGGITDDGTGVLFDGGNKTPTPNDPTQSGDPTYGTLLDDDRPLTVNSIDVNEDSPFGVFTVSGEAGQQVRLTLSDGSAGSADYGPSLEYWDGIQWQNYTAGSYISIPAGDGTLLVRTPVIDDNSFEGVEYFMLTATNTGGAGSVGYGFIHDDGTGIVYKDDGTENSAVTKDDDRILTVVSAGTVNEGSQYAMFTVSAEDGYLVDLALGNTSTTSDIDATIDNFTFEYSIDGGVSWATYSWDGSTGLRPTAPTDGKIYVRVDISSEADVPYEGAETFSLTASYDSNSSNTANDTATIIDDGTGNKYTGTVTGGTPATNSTNLDDDQIVLSVTGFGPVNEGSTYAIFKVDGKASDSLDLAISNGTATLASDALIEFSYDGISWTNYSNLSQPVVPGNGTVYVRTSITSEADEVLEGAETFSLVVGSVSSPSISAAAETSIIDDGTGLKYGPDVVSGIPTTSNENLDDDTPEIVVSVVPEAIVSTASYTPPPPPPSEPVEEPESEPVVEIMLAPTKGELLVQRDIPEQVFSSPEGLTVISFSIPADTFGHTEPGAEITLSALLIDGEELPYWLIFDSEKGEFRGIAPEGYDGAVIIRVIARDHHGNQVETIVTIHIRPDVNDQTQTGKVHLMEQLHSQSQFAWKAERDRLIQVAKSATQKSTDLS